MKRRETTGDGGDGNRHAKRPAHNDADRCRPVGTLTITMVPAATAVHMPPPPPPRVSKAVAAGSGDIIAIPSSAESDGHAKMNFLREPGGWWILRTVMKKTVPQIRGYCSC